MISRKNELLMAAGDMSVSINSDPIDVRNLVIASLQIVMTGAPIGTIKLQCSNDTFEYLKQPGIQPAAVNWTDIADSSLGVSAAGNIVYNLTSLGYDQLRVVYTAVSGTGTMSIRMVGKG
jgi:hypothetical protein